MYAKAIAYQSILNRTTALLAGATALFIFLYGAFLLGAVFHTAARASLERDIRTHTSSLSSLESSYLEKSRALTLQRAHEMGFVEPARVTTVFASVPQKTLTLGESEFGSGQ